MKQFASLEQLFSHYMAGLKTALESFTDEKRNAISEDIVASWFGNTANESLVAPISEHSEIIWRTIYLQQAVIELNEFGVWAKAVPIRSVKLPEGEQLKFIRWAYLSKVSIFQDRLFKFYRAASSRSLASEKQKFHQSSKKFAEQFLAPIKVLIDIRNHWTHDSEPEFSGLKQLTSLEVALFAYGSDPQFDDLQAKLKREHRKVIAAEKLALTTLIMKYESAFLQLADIVVVFSSSYSNLSVTE